MAIALLTNYLAPYRVPLYEELAQRHRLQVLLYGGGERYVPAWFSDLDGQLAASRVPARRLDGLREALSIGADYETIIAPFAGGAILPAAYTGARRNRAQFILWASVWAQPRSPAHLAAAPLTRHIYRHADAVIAYGEHVRSFVADIRGRDNDVFVAPQSVEPELFGREVASEEVGAFRARHDLPPGPLVLYVGRIVAQKGLAVLADAWPRLRSEATLVLIGDGALVQRIQGLPRTRLLGPLPREELPSAYAAAKLTLLPAVPTPRFREPWGLVCNESMHQGRPVIASDAVGAVAGGLVRDGESGLVVPAGDPLALAGAIDRLLTDEQLRSQLGDAAKKAVAGYTYEAMVGAFERALESTGSAPREPH